MEEEGLGNWLQTELEGRVINGLEVLTNTRIWSLLILMKLHTNKINLRLRERVEVSRKKNQL